MWRPLASASMDTQLLPFATQDVPRYTSYPTAVQFQPGFPGVTADQWLTSLNPDATLSVYVHIPFCRQLCWYCGCHTSVPNSYDRAARYVEYLVKDIRRSAALFQGRKGKVTHLHFGGGTPTYLDDLHIGEIVEAIDKGFGLAPGGEMALESDPRTLTRERARVLASMGFNRISFGVQDFATPVQMKINRLQTYGLVAAATEFLREAGFTSVNFDLMYGLPAQTVESVARTAEQAAGLRPERISVFGYAHVPWFKKHQKMINDAELPGVRERYAQATTIERELNAHGYASIGLDHFALEGDELTRAARTGAMRRNFQGYTTDVSDALLAFGASAIGEFPGGFVQSARDTLEWSQHIDRNESPVTRGLATTAEDRMRVGSDRTPDVRPHAWTSAAIAQTPRLSTRRSSMTSPKNSNSPVAAGIAEISGSRISVPPRHRLFLRTVAAAFDAHFVSAPNRHAKAV